MDDYNKAKELWNNFKEEIEHNNRYFSGKEIIEILKNIKLIGNGKTYKHHYMYRARIGNLIANDDSDILSPPKEMAKGGRCNPFGIPYLYMANDEDAAISEIRANIGEVVTIVKLEVEDIELFSFDSYGIAAEKDRLENRFFRDLMRIIDEDLSKVIIDKEIINYIPLQFIAEFIKVKTPYKGISFSSSTSDGINYVIFEPDNINIRIVEKYLVKIENIKYEYNRLE